MLLVANQLRNLPFGRSWSSRLHIWGESHAKCILFLENCPSFFFGEMKKWAKGKHDICPSAEGHCSAGGRRLYVAIGSCTSDHRRSVTQMELFLLLLFDVLKQNVELRKQLGNEGCVSVFSLPTVTHISNEACGRPLNSYVSVSPSIKWKRQHHTLCKGFWKLANQREEIWKKKSVCLSIPWQLGLLNDKTNCCQGGEL